MDITVKIKVPSLSPRGVDLPKKSIIEAVNLPKPQGSEFKTHKVKKGDTIQSIAEEYGIDPFDFANFVREKEGNEMLYPGQELEIPILSNSSSEDDL